MGKRMGDIRKEKGIGGPPILKGSDVPKGVRSVKIKIRELREGGRDFLSPAVIDFEKPVFEKEAMALNITNLRALARTLGWDDDEFDDIDFNDLADKAKGRVVTLDVVSVNNPKTKRMGPGLSIHE
jgi:hypothetical protein